MNHTKRFVVGAVILGLVVPIMPIIQYLTGNRLAGVIVAVILGGIGFLGFQVPAFVQAYREQKDVERDFYRNRQIFETELAQQLILERLRKEGSSNRKSSEHMINQ